MKLRICEFVRCSTADLVLGGLVVAGLVVANRDVPQMTSKRHTGISFFIFHSLKSVECRLQACAGTLVPAPRRTLAVFQERGGPRSVCGGPTDEATIIGSSGASILAVGTGRSCRGTTRVVGS